MVAKVGVIDVTTQKPAGVRLTMRERQLIAALLDGCSNKQIAARFGVSDQTVKNQLTGLYLKVGVTSRVELVVWAMRHQADLS